MPLMYLMVICHSWLLISHRSRMSKMLSPCHGYHTLEIMVQETLEVFILGYTIKKTLTHAFDHQCKSKAYWGALVGHCVERVPYRLSPDHSDPGSNPARGPLLHVLPYISHSFLSITLYKNATKKKHTDKGWQYTAPLVERDDIVGVL